MIVQYNAGMRHVLVVFPLLAVVAVAGVTNLWKVSGRMRTTVRCALVMLLCWQGFETLHAQHDFIAYFNELAGTDPSWVMVAGCDLDCGQDVFRLATELRKRNISDFSLAIWSSAEMKQMGLPRFEVLQPFKPVSGWVAISSRALRFGDVLHQTYPPDSLAWIQAFRPVENVGRTIRLYHVPPERNLATQTTRVLPSRLR